MSAHAYTIIPPVATVTQEGVNTNPVTLNAARGFIKAVPLTSMASGSSYKFTLNNSLLRSDSNLRVGVASVRAQSGVQARIVLVCASVNPVGGSATIVLYNPANVYTTQYFTLYFEILD